MLCYDLNAGTSPKQKFYFGSFSESPTMCQVHINSPPSPSPRLFSGGLKTLSGSHGPGTEGAGSLEWHTSFPCAVSVALFSPHVSALHSLPTVLASSTAGARSAVAQVPRTKMPLSWGSLLRFLYPKIMPPALVGVPG